MNNFEEPEKMAELEPVSDYDESDGSFEDEKGEEIIEKELDDFENLVKDVNSLTNGDVTLTVIETNTEENSENKKSFDDIMNKRIKENDKEWNARLKEVRYQMKQELFFEVGKLEDKWRKKEESNKSGLKKLQERAKFDRKTWKIERKKKNNEKRKLEKEIRKLKSQSPDDIAEAVRIAKEDRNKFWVAKLGEIRKECDDKVKRLLEEKIEDEERTFCQICFERKRDFALYCGHITCEQCAQSMFKESMKTKEQLFVCPFCRNSNMVRIGNKIVL